MRQRLSVAVTPTRSSRDAASWAILACRALFVNSRINRSSAAAITLVGARMEIMLILYARLGAVKAPLFFVQDINTQLNLDKMLILYVL